MVHDNSRRSERLKIWLLLYILRKVWPPPQRHVCLKKPDPRIMASKTESWPLIVRCWTICWRCMTQIKSFPRLRAILIAVSGRPTRLNSMLPMGFAETTGSGTFMTNTSSRESLKGLLQSAETVCLSGEQLQGWPVAEDCIRRHVFEKNASSGTRRGAYPHANQQLVDVSQLSIKLPLSDG